VGSAVTLSAISRGDYFTVFNSNVSVGETNTIFRSFDTSNNLVGITTSYIDSTYQAASDSTITRTVGGVSTSVLRVNANIVGISTLGFSSTTESFDSTLFTLDNTGLSNFTGGISTSNYFGEFSWGKVVLTRRTKQLSYEARTLSGISGISTSDSIFRTKHLRFENYAT